MSNRVICGVCSNQAGGFCSFKKSKVKLKKRRVCDKFRHDTGKVKITQEIPSTKRPDWYWLNRPERKKLLKEMIAEAKKQMEEKAKMTTPTSGDPNHPLTGNLGRFTTTAGKKEEESE